MRSIIWLWVGVCLLVAACGSPDAPAGTPSESAAKPFVVAAEGIHLRVDAGPGGAILRPLPPGTPLYDLGKVSNFTTAIRLGGIPYDEPWLYVQTAEGEKGWVYAGGLQFEWRADSLALPARLLEKRLQTWFGPEIARQIAVYRGAFEQVRSADSFAVVYRQGMTLRTQLVAQLEVRIRLSPGETPPPDLFWLREAFPAFVPQLVAEGTAYYLFADYRQWRRCARNTPETGDDQFVELCLTAFPEDSIEFFFPAWTIQTWDYGGHSLLGRGIHRKMLRQMDRCLAAGDRFRPEIDALKKQVIADITDPEMTYWEPLDRIVGELEAIVAQPPDCLLRYDRIALQGRLDQFRDPASAGIIANKRAGE